MFNYCVLNHLEAQLKAPLLSGKHSVLTLKQRIMETKQHFLDNEELHFKYMVLILSICT